MVAIDSLDRQFHKLEGECLSRQFHFLSSKSNVNNTSPLADEISVEGHVLWLPDRKNHDARSTNHSGQGDQEHGIGNFFKNDGECLVLGSQREKDRVDTDQE